MVAVSGGFSVEGKFRPFGRRINQSQRDPNYTQPAHIRPPCAGERGGYQLGSIRASPTRPDNHRETGHTALANRHTPWMSQRCLSSVATRADSFRLLIPWSRSRKMA